MMFGTNPIIDMFHGSEWLAEPAKVVRPKCCPEKFHKHVKREGRQDDVVNDHERLHFKCFPRLHELFEKSTN